MQMTASTTATTKLCCLTVTSRCRPFWLGGTQPICHSHLTSLEAGFRWFLVTTGTNHSQWLVHCCTLPWQPKRSLRLDWKEVRLWPESPTGKRGWPEICSAVWVGITCCYYQYEPVNVQKHELCVCTWPLWETVQCCTKQRWSWQQGCKVFPAEPDSSPELAHLHKRKHFAWPAQKSAHNKHKWKYLTQTVYIDWLQMEISHLTKISCIYM